MIRTTHTFTPIGGKVLDPQRILRAVGVSRGMSVGDFGCGHNGHFVFPAARLVGTDGYVHAVDIQSNVAQTIDSLAKSDGLTNIFSIVADAEKMGATKIPASTLDIVLLINNQVDAVAHNNMLREALRAVRAAGHIIVIDWLGGNTVPFAPAIEERVDKDVVLRSAQGLGLRFVDEFRPGRYHYGLRFQKT